MSFLAPTLLWGALAAGIPIALHFFYRSRYRTVPWAAMKFLLTSIEQTSRRLRFQELLLLLLRVLLLVLLAVALARPTSLATGLAGQGDAVDAVLLLDTSLSMDARAGVAGPVASNDPYQQALRQFARADGAITAFDRARAAAIAVLAGLPPHSTVQVIACADRAQILGPHTPSRLDQARVAIEGASLTHLTTDFLPGVRLAADFLRRGPSPNKELYLFSDMQRRGWEAQSAALVSALDELRQSTNIHLVHCVPARLANVSLTGITPQSTLRTGERADFAVLLRNTGQVPVRNLTVSLQLNQSESARDSQPVAEVQPGETRAVVLSVPLERPGRQVLSATVRSDDLEGDNHLDQIIQVADQVGVLLVDGTPNASDARRAASYFLQHALNPLQPGAGAGLPVTVVPADRAAPRDLEGKEACLLVNVRLEPTGGAQDSSTISDEFIRALAVFVQQQHPLVLFPGDRLDIETYNRILFEQLRLLPYRIDKVETTTPERAWRLDRSSADRPPLDRFRVESGYASINRIESRRRLALSLPTGEEAKSLAEESRVLLRFNDGAPAIVARQRPGAGEVVLFATSVHDPAWSDLFVSPAFVPIVQVMLSHLLEGRPAQFNRIAGEPLVWAVSQDEAQLPFDLIGLTGERERVGTPQVVAGRAVLTTNRTSRAGLYHLVPADREPTDRSPLFAVEPDLRELDDLQSFRPAEIDERLGFRPLHLTAGEDGAIFSGAERARREWTMWLLAAVLLLVLVEMLFAWYCGRAW